MQLTAAWEPYGTELWGCGKHTNVKIIQTVRNKILRIMIWYLTNASLYKDLNIPYIHTNRCHIRSHRHALRLEGHHPNNLDDHFLNIF